MSNKGKSQTRYACEHCNVTFKVVASLKKHKVEKHNSNETINSTMNERDNNSSAIFTLPGDDDVLIEALKDLKVYELLDDISNQVSVESEDVTNETLADVHSKLQRFRTIMKKKDDLLKKITDKVKVKDCDECKMREGSDSLNVF